MVPQDGIADLSFQLSDEPLLGTYVINVTSAKAYSSFSVEEYGMSMWGICLSCREDLALLIQEAGCFFHDNHPGILGKVIASVTENDLS